MDDNTTASTAVESFVTQEIVGHLDLAAGLLAHAKQSFVDIGAIFDAIYAAALKGSLMSRLAQLGVNVTSSLECDFAQYSAIHIAHVARYHGPKPFAASDPDI